MDTMSAFMRGKVASLQGAKQKVFDWDKAAMIIKKQNVKFAEAGLSQDLEWTSGEILKDGKPVDRNNTYTYLSSNWAIPVLIIDGEEIECFIDTEKQETEWDSGTYWPDSALQILKEVE